MYGRRGSVRRRIATPRTRPPSYCPHERKVAPVSCDCKEGVPIENYSLEGLLSNELTFTPIPKENVLSTLYTLRLYPALKSSERVRL